MGPEVPNLHLTTTKGFRSRRANVRGPHVHAASVFVVCSPGDGVFFFLQGCYELLNIVMFRMFLMQKQFVVLSLFLILDLGYVFFFPGGGGG